MNDQSRSRELAAYALFEVFKKDDTIDSDELEKLKKLALEDSIVDEEEKRVLRNVFSRVTRESIEPEAWLAIEAFRQQHDI